MKKLLLTALVAAAPLAGYAANFSFSTNINSMEHGTAHTWGLNGTTTSSKAYYGTLLTEVKKANTTITSATLTINDIWDWQNSNPWNDPADVLFVNILTGLNGGLDSYEYNSNSPTDDVTFGSNVFLAGATGNTSAMHSAMPFTNANGNNANGNSLLVYTGDHTVTSYNGQANPGTWSDPYGGSEGRTGYPNGFDLVINFTPANIKLLEAFLEADSSTSNPTVGLGFSAECHYYSEGITLSITTTTGTTPPPPGVPDNANTLILLGSVMALAAGIRRFVKKSVA